VGNSSEFVGYSSFDGYLLSVDTESISGLVFSKR